MALEESEFSKIVKEHRATITEMGYPEPLFEEAMQELRLQGKIFTSVPCSKSIKLRYFTKNTNYQSKANHYNAAVTHNLCIQFYAFVHFSLLVVKCLKKILNHFYEKSVCQNDILHKIKFFESETLCFFAELHLIKATFHRSIFAF